MKKYYRSGELARLAGVSTDTLRHYERMGLITRARRSENGYRELQGREQLGLALVSVEPLLSVNRM